MFVKTQEELVKHISTSHSFECNYCEVIERTQDALTNHIDSNHVGNNDEDNYECEVCDFEGTSQIIMVEHVILCHTKKSDDNKFDCENCDSRFDSKNSDLEHFKSTHMHGTQSNDLVTIDKEDDIDNSLKEEYRKLENHFERLNGMYQESVKEAVKEKLELTAN